MEDPNAICRRFGLIGYPLTHSFSKHYFTQKFQSETISDAEYELYPIEHISLFPDLLKKTGGLHGLNITIPYKESIIPFLDELDEVASAVKAVNTIRISKQKDGWFLKGFNTDVYGFRQSVKPFLASHHERALILGTGGASKAVAYVLQKIGLDCYYVTRDKSHLPQGINPSRSFVYTELNEEMMKHFPMIVNTSPVGMYPHTGQAPEIPYTGIGPSHFLYDLIYNPEETLFLKRGKERGAITLNGLSMLQQQAEEAWRIWNEKE